MYATKSLITLICIIALTWGAYGYVFPGNKHCPFNNKTANVSWQDYLSGKLGDKEPPFSIRFNRNMGTIVSSRCYTITYHGNGTWNGVGYNSAQREVVSDVRTGAPLEQFMMNVWGLMLTFNEAGEVYNAQGELVGQMKCLIGTDC